MSYRRNYQGSEHGRRVRAKNQRLRAARQRDGVAENDPRIVALYEQAVALEGKLRACVMSDDPFDLKIHVDHIVPLSKGGKHVFENLQLLDARENMWKGAAA